MMKIQNFSSRKAEYPIEEVFLKRWSPRAFNPKYEIPTETLLSLLEAARWAPSSNNKQPWRFMYAKRDSQAFHALCKCLTGFNNV